MAFSPQYGYGQPTYQTYLPNQDQMAQMRAQQYMPQMNGMQMNQQMNMQQPQQGGPIWVQGEAGAKSFLVAPGQTVQLMDSEADVFYIKATDQSGVPLPLRTFDYKERTTGAQRPVQAAQMPMVDYVTRAEFDALAAKLAELTAKPATHSVELVQAQPQRRRQQREVEGMIDA